MSRTSSKRRDSGRPVTRRRAVQPKGSQVKRERGGFERTFWTLVASLVFVATVFFLLGNQSAPQLSSAEIDPSQLTERSGQQLRFLADQPLDEVAPLQVTVTPSARVSPSVQGNVLVLQFDERLRYGTEYVVEVSGVAAPDGNATATFTYRFTTGSGSVLYLDRGDDRDEVLRVSLDESGRGEVVYAAPGIQHIAPLDGLVVVARDAQGGSSVLEAVAPDGSVRPLVLPEGVRIDDFIVPSSGTLLAMTLTTVRNDIAREDLLSALAVVDVALDGIVEILPGPDGAPMSILNAAFVPDAATLIVHASDQELLRVELTEPPLALPIVQIPEMYALSTDGTRLTGSDEQGGVVINLATTEESRLEPTLIDGELVSGDAILTSTELFLQKVSLTDPDTGAPREVLVADNGSGFARVLVRADNGSGGIGDFRISSNDQFVAVEVTSALGDAVADDRLVNGRATSVITVIVDIQTGTVVRTLEGFSPIW